MRIDQEHSLKTLYWEAGGGDAGVRAADKQRTKRTDQDQEDLVAAVVSEGWEALPWDDDAYDEEDW